MLPPSPMPRTVVLVPVLALVPLWKMPRPPQVAGVRGVGIPLDLEQGMWKRNLAGRIVEAEVGVGREGIRGRGDIGDVVRHLEIGIGRGDIGGIDIKVGDIGGVGLGLGVGEGIGVEAPEKIKLIAGWIGLIGGLIGGLIEPIGAWIAVWIGLIELIVVLTAG